MSSTTFTGNIRSGLNKDGLCGNAVFRALISITPTQSSAGTGFVLPKGAVITGIVSLGGATGGTNPTIDVGTAASSANICNELDADTAGTAGTLGALAWTVLAADTEVYAGVGASAATGGKTSFLLEYVRTDVNGTY